VKPKAPHIPWGRKRIRGKAIKTEEAGKKDDAAKFERRLIQGCFEGFA